MYFPYLRGRQYELISVREGIKSEVISKNIIAIIEPVKLSATLLSTMRTAIEKNKKIAIICNSNISSFFDDIESFDKKKEKKEFFALLKEKSIIKAFLTKEDWQEDIEEYQDIIEFDEKELMIICNDSNFVDEFEDRYDEDDIYPKYVLIPDKKRFYRKISKNKILFEDRFVREERNSDYSKNIDAFFSDDHLEYEDGEYIGFSDYATIGEKYMEGGFAPYAIAIHITYLDDDDSIRIHHFVSDSNNDIKDPAKKFYEANKKLYEFEFSKASRTQALEMFYDHYHKKDYPGLGSIKKLSLLHHLELINNYLD